MTRPESPQTKAREPPADLCAQVCRPAGPRQPPAPRGPVQRPHLASDAQLAASRLCLPGLEPIRAARLAAKWLPVPTALPPPPGCSQGPVRRSPPNGSPSPTLCPLTCAGSHPACAPPPCSAHSRTPVRPGETASLHASCSPRVLRAGPLPAPVGAPRRRPRPCGRRARSQTLQLGDAARGRAHRIPSYDLEEAEAAAGLTVDGELSRCHLRRCRASQVRREMPAGAPAAWRRADAGRLAPRPP